MNGNIKTQDQKDWIHKLQSSKSFSGLNIIKQHNVHISHMLLKGSKTVTMKTDGSDQLSSMSGYGPGPKMKEKKEK